MIEEIIEYCIEGLTHVAGNDWDFNGEPHTFVKEKKQSRNRCLCTFAGKNTIKECLTTSTGRVIYDGFNEVEKEYTEEQRKELEVLFQHAYYKKKTKHKRQKIREMISVTKICPICGTKFKTNSKKRIYCCHKCTLEGNKLKQAEKRVPKVYTCKQCGKEFTSPSKKFQVFCCKKHAHKYWNDLAHAKLLANRVVESKICPVCGKEFTPDYDHRVYCSTKCRLKQSRERIKILKWRS